MAVDSQTVEKIILYMPNWLGDVIMALPALRELRRLFPNLEIFVFTQERYAPLYEHEGVDGIITVPNDFEISKLGMLIETTNKVKDKEFDLGILFTNSFSSALFFFLCGIEKRVGFKKELRGFLLSKAVPMGKGIKKLHQMESFLFLLRSGLGLKSEKNKKKLKIDDLYLGVAQRFFEKKGIREDATVVGFGVGSAYGLAKDWFPERYARLAKMLQEEYNARIICFGTKQEKDTANMIEERLEKNAVINLIGHTTIPEAAGMLQKCSLFIGNDSGLAHLSAALDVPTIVIFGSTSYVKTAPQGESVHIISKDVKCAPCFKRVCPNNSMECMKSISVADVFNKAGELL